jgi:hypothetical protein
MPKTLKQLKEEKPDDGAVTVAKPRSSKGVRSGSRAPSRLAAIITRGLTTSYPIKRKKFYARDISHCYRQAASFLLVSEEFKADGSAAGSFYMNTGTAVHDTIAQAFRQAGVSVAEEFKLAEMGLTVGGRIDNIIKLGDEYAIVEIKTCGELPSSPKPEHKAQAMFYSLATGIRKVFVLYASRSIASFGGDLKMTEYELVTTDDELYEVAFNASVSYFSALSGKRPPMPTYFTARSKCGFCPFMDKCWDGATLDGVEDMTPSEFLKVTSLASDFAKRLMGTIEARRIQTEGTLARLIEQAKETKDEPTV